MTAAQLAYWQRIDCVAWKPGLIVNEIGDYPRTLYHGGMEDLIKLAFETEMAISRIINLTPRKL